MTNKLLTEKHLEILSLKGGCTCLSECIHVKIPHCWKSHIAVQMLFAANLGWHFMVSNFYKYHYMLFLLVLSITHILHSLAQFVSVN